MKNLTKRTLFAGLGLLAMACLVQAQEPAQTPPATPAPAAPAAPAALPTPAITGPLAGLPPAIFDAGPFGKIAVNGFLSGMGTVQTSPVPGDSTRHADLSNGQVFIQKTDGWFQFYLQAGAYTLPALATPFLGTNDTLTNNFNYHQNIYSVYNSYQLKLEKCFYTVTATHFI